MKSNANTELLLQWPEMSHITSSTQAYADVGTLTREIEFISHHIKQTIHIINKLNCIMAVAG